LLCRLQDTIRDAVPAAQHRGGNRLTRVAAVTTADTIYGIDKVSEHAVLRGLRRTGRSAGRWSW
jgi:hypothetical protein